VQGLLDDQAGVVARRQLLQRGATDVDVRRWVRRRELTRVHNGVFVNQTGPLSWSSRSWAAVLLYWPAALSHGSAVDRAGSLIHVAVAADRNVLRRPGVALHLLGCFEERVQWNTGPPRIRLEDALLMMCTTADSRADALRLLTDACRRRLTNPDRLLAELERHRQVKRRAWLREVLGDAATGVQSVLESGYLRRVERAHALPSGLRQRRDETAHGVVYRDLTYGAYGVVVELDGRMGHDLSRDRWNDMDRDLDAALAGMTTVRLGWRHVEDRPCETAQALAHLLRARGWRGGLRRCAASCRLPKSARPDTGPRIPVTT
jgi:hypothetical protein